jgi:hypothetical protein
VAIDRAARWTPRKTSCVHSAAPVRRTISKQ